MVAAGGRGRGNDRSRLPAVGGENIGFGEFCRRNPMAPPQFSVRDLPRHLVYAAAQRLQAVYDTAGMSADLCPVHCTAREVAKHAERALQRTPHHFFKVGVCCKPAERFGMYLAERGVVRRMLVLWCTADRSTLNDVEGSLIFQNEQHGSCLNSRRGVDKLPRADDPPWFLYLVFN